MDRLKKKVFLTIFLILSMAVFCLLLIFNTQKYTAERANIINSLNVAIKNNNPDKREEDIPPKPKEEPEINNNDSTDENIKYMDTIIYTILLDSNNNIIDIINHSK